MMKTNFNKSKIIATIGPASMSSEVLEKMIRAGVDVCRINASHGDHAIQQEVVDIVRKLNADKKFKVAILFCFCCEISRAFLSGIIILLIV